jgi:hypothetical protein
MARSLSHWRSGHPALRSNLCLQCYRHSDVGILCSACSRASAEEHRDQVANINKRRGSLCRYCSEESVGVGFFSGGCTAFCEKHVREWRSLDFTPRHGFVSYSALPGLVQR